MVIIVIDKIKHLALSENVSEEIVEKSLFRLNWLEIASIMTSESEKSEVQKSFYAADCARKYHYIQFDRELENRKLQLTDSNAPKQDAQSSNHDTADVKNTNKKRSRQKDDDVNSKKKGKKSKNEVASSDKKLKIAYDYIRTPNMTHMPDDNSENDEHEKKKTNRKVKGSNVPWEPDEVLFYKSALHYNLVTGRQAASSCKKSDLFISKWKGHLCANISFGI